MKSKLWLKITSIILFVVLTAVMALSVLAAGIGIYYDVYSDDGKSFIENVELDMLLAQLGTVSYDFKEVYSAKGMMLTKSNNYRGDVWEYDSDTHKFVKTTIGEAFDPLKIENNDFSGVFGYRQSLISFDDDYSFKNYDYPFTIYNEDGEAIKTNFLPSKDAKFETRQFSVDVLSKMEHLSLQFDSRIKLEYYLEDALKGGIYNSEVYYIPDEDFESLEKTPMRVTWCLEADYIPIETVQYELVMYYPDSYKTGVQAKEMAIAQLLVDYRYLPFILAIPSLILMVIIFIYLVCSAGHKEGVEGITPNFIDKIPFDLYLAILVTIVGIEFAILDSGWNDYIMLALYCIFAVITLLLLIGLVMTLTTRAKLGTVFKNTVIWKLAALIFKVIKTVALFIIKCFKKLFGAIGYLFKNMNLYWKAGLLALAYIIVEFVLIILMYEIPEFIIAWIAFQALMLCYMAFRIIAFSKLKKASNELALGKIDTKVERKYLFGDFIKCADSLDGIGEGINKAVQEKMKSERLKTELITNVSHDLKTPLTSIVNYVDILSKQDIKPDEAKEYVNVLVRQSQRMKKLIDDLIEASKASTGSTTVDLQRSDVSLLLSQAAVEYEERFEKSNLTLKMSLPEKPLVANIDGKLMWRVFDNLLGNIVKYTQPSTRVYIVLDQVGENIIISFKNISKYELNISEDELMERFKRGDSSRSTEGSGLGLSIAQSLCVLQNSKLDIEIDGDLFKASITIPKAFDDELING